MNKCNLEDRDKYLTHATSARIIPIGAVVNEINPATHARRSIMAVLAPWMFMLKIIIVVVLFNFFAPTLNFLLLLLK